MECRPRDADTTVLILQDVDVTKQDGTEVMEVVQVSMLVASWLDCLRAKLVVFHELSAPRSSNQEPEEENSHSYSWRPL